MNTQEIPQLTLDEAIHLMEIEPSIEDQQELAQMLHCRRQISDGTMIDLIHIFNL